MELVEVNRPGAVLVDRFEDRLGVPELFPMLQRAEERLPFCNVPLTGLVRIKRVKDAPGLDPGRVVRALACKSIHELECVIRRVEHLEAQVQERHATITVRVVRWRALHVRLKSLVTSGRRSMRTKRTISAFHPVLSETGMRMHSNPNQHKSSLFVAGSMSMQ